MDTLIQYPNTMDSNSFNLFCLDRMLELNSLKLSSSKKLFILKYKVHELKMLSNGTAHCVNLTDLVPLPFDKQCISFFGLDDNIQYDIIRTFTIGLLACYVLDFSLEIFCKSSIAIFIDNIPKLSAAAYNTHLKISGELSYTLLIDPTNKITLSNDNDYILKGNLPSLPRPMSQGGMINTLKDKQVNILVMH